MRHLHSGHIHMRIWKYSADEFDCGSNWGRSTSERLDKAKLSLIGMTLPCDFSFFLSLTIT